MFLRLFILFIFSRFLLSLHQLAAINYLHAQTVKCSAVKFTVKSNLKTCSIE